jgi:hypothetical protein
VGQIFLQNSFRGLLLDLEHGSHLLKSVFELLFQIVGLFLELFIYQVDLHLIWFLQGRIMKMLVHLHEALCSNVDLLQHVLLHSDIMLLVVAEQGAVGADALLTIDANNLDLAAVNRAHVRSIFLDLGDARI